ncbi:MAG: hypothetical protein GX443_10510 [Deltaproteobacteria bacterium]|nr:hypothetical protein [Deltaproteobacteria bacterium]
MVGSPLDLQDLNQWAGFVVGTLLALVVQGEGEAFFVLMFQVYSQREKITYDLNPAHHMDPRALPALIVAGWAWSRKRMVKPPYFPGAWLPCTLVPLAGAIAVVLLCGILGSFYMFLPGQVLRSAVEASTVIAVANLLVPVPPLALGRALFCPFQDATGRERYLDNFGAIVVTGVALVEYWMKWPLFQPLILPVSDFLVRWILQG